MPLQLLAEPQEEAPDEDLARSNDELAQELQNPLADLVSLPFQNNTSFNVGPEDDVSNVLNIQPVAPIDMGEYNILTRTIVPLVYVPSFSVETETGTTDVSSEFGLGDINFTPFFAPKGDDFIWGIGPSINMDTSTDERLGTRKWSLGPSAVLIAQPGNWTVGGLVRQLWDFAGSDNSDQVNQTFIQPIVAYGLGDGWTVNTGPFIIANWQEDSSDRWTLPVGLGVQKLVRVGGKLPLNIGLQGYGNVERPSGGADYEIRTQFTFILPKFY